MCDGSQSMMIVLKSTRATNINTIPRIANNIPSKPDTMVPVLSEIHRQHVFNNGFAIFGI